MITNPKYNLLNLNAPSTVYVGDGKVEMSPPQLLGKS